MNEARENKEWMKKWNMMLWRVGVIGMVIGCVLTLAVVAYCRGRAGGMEPDTQTVIVTDPSGEQAEEVNVTVEYVASKLEMIGELSTAEMIYCGLLTVEEGQIPILTRKGFSMAYSGIAKAGIEVAAIDITVTNDCVYVTLPEAEIIMCKVDPESVAFYDAKHALFNWTEKTDVTQALVLAEDHMAKQADLDELPKQASKHAEVIVKALLQDVVGNRTLIVKTV